MSIKSDLKDLLALPSPTRRQRLHRRIIRAILNAPDAQGQTRHLGEVATVLERAYWASSGTTRHDLKRAVDELWCTLASELLDQQTIELFAQNWCTMRNLVHRGVNAQRVLVSRGVFADDAELEYAARQWFFLEYCRWIGATPERSIAFALLLLGHIGLRSAELVRDAPLEGSPRRSVATEHLGHVQVFLHVCASSVVHRTAPQKNWIERIIEVAQRDRAASEVLASLLSCLTNCRADNMIRTVIQREAAPGESPDAPAAALKREQLVDDRWCLDLLAPTLVLTKRHDALLMAWNEVQRVEGDTNRAHGRALLAWFEEHVEVIAARGTACLREIVERPRRALLPGGLDHVEIAVSALRNTGIRAVVFRPEGYTFPNVGVEIIIRKATPHLQTYRTTLDTLDGFPVEELANAHHPDVEQIAALLVYVIVDALHRIVVADRPLRERKRIARTLLERSTTSRELHLIPDVFRRAHLRRLSPGQRTSVHAQTRAQETSGWSLPDGITFVRAHYQRRDRALTYALPTSPIATYTDDDLRNLGEVP